MTRCCFICGNEFQFDAYREATAKFCSNKCRGIYLHMFPNPLAGRPKGSGSREKNPNWKGGFYIARWGYKKLLMPEHHRADPKGYVLEHVVIAESALGKRLPHKAVVHHHSKDQLVICQDQAYHMLLHKRTRDLEKRRGHVTP